MKREFHRSLQNLVALFPIPTNYPRSACNDHPVCIKTGEIPETTEGVALRTSIAREQWRLVDDILALSTRLELPNYTAGPSANDRHDHVSHFGTTGTWPQG